MTLRVTLTELDISPGSPDGLATVRANFLAEIWGIKDADKAPSSANKLHRLRCNSSSLAHRMDFFTAGCCRILRICNASTSGVECWLIECSSSAVGAC